MQRKGEERGEEGKGREEGEGQGAGRKGRSGEGGQCPQGQGPSSMNHWSTISGHRHYEMRRNPMGVITSMENGK